MKNIQITEEEFKQLKQLRKEYKNLYGDENTVWDFEDLNGLRQIGQEFMGILASHFNDK